MKSRYRLDEKTNTMVEIPSDDEERPAPAKPEKLVNLPEIHTGQYL